MYNIAVMVSGKGSTLDNLGFHTKDEINGMITAAVDITHVVADRECDARQIAEKWDIPFYVCNHEELFEEKHGNVDLWVMGGFLSKIRIPDELYGKVINIHPSLLPRYGGEGMYGIHVHEAVIEAGEKITGVTVHIVDEEYDHGPVIERMKVGVLPTDTPTTLQLSVRDMENLLYPRAILNHLQLLNKRTQRTSDWWSERDEQWFQEWNVPKLKEKGWTDEHIDKILGTPNR